MFISFVFPGSERPIRDLFCQVQSGQIIEPPSGQKSQPALPPMVSRYLPIASIANNKHTPSRFAPFLESYKSRLVVHAREWSGTRYISSLGIDLH